MKQIIFLTICIFLSLTLFGQESTVLDKIILKTGDVYVGKIVLKTNEIIMLTTKSGMRYQFRVSEIKETGSESVSDLTKNEETKDVKTDLPTGNLGGLVELSGGFSYAKFGFGWSPDTQFSLLFGHRNVLNQHIFIGPGVGYKSTFIASGSKTYDFLPLFLRIQRTYPRKHGAPYAGMDVGYAYALNTGYKGGSLVKISVGITYKINFNTSFFAGIYAGVQAFSGNLTETFEQIPYTYYGETTIRSVGLKTGLQF